MLIASAYEYHLLTMWWRQRRWINDSVYPLTETELLRLGVSMRREFAHSRDQHFRASCVISQLVQRGRLVATWAFHGNSWEIRPGWFLGVVWSIVAMLAVGWRIVMSFKELIQKGSNFLEPLCDCPLAGLNNRPHHYEWRALRLS